MSLKRKSSENISYDGVKICKYKSGQSIGFCDVCTKHAAVRFDKQTQLKYCIECEMDDLAFMFEFVEVTPNNLFISNE